MRSLTHSFFAGACLLLVTGTLSTHAAAEPQQRAVEMGILPTLSARTILKTYQPVRDYLEAGLDQPIQLVTAPDYRTFVERTQSGTYRYLVTAPHFARFAQQEAGYQPLVRVRRELRALLVADATRTVRTVDDLRGQVVTAPDPLAIITMLGAALLREHGLQPGKDVTVQRMPSFNSAVIAVLNGKSAGAITAATALRQMPANVRDRLVTIASSEVVPHVIYMAGPEVPHTEVERARNLLLNMSADPNGLSFLERTGFAGLDPVSDDELKSLDPYVTELKQALTAP